MKLKRRLSPRRATAELSKLALACAAVVLAGQTTHGAGTIYTLPDGSLASWQNAPWTVSGTASPNLFPNAAGDTAQFNGATATSTTLDLDSENSITIGSLLNSGTGNWTIRSGTSNGFDFDNTGGSGNAKISTTGAGNLIVQPVVSFENNLDISTGSNQAGTITLSSIFGTGNLSLSGARGQTVITASTVNNTGTLSASVSTTGFATTDFSVGNVGDQVTAITVGSATNTFGGSLSISGTSFSTGPILIQGAAALRTSSLGLNAGDTTNGITIGANGGTLAALAGGGGITTAKAITLNGTGSFTTTAADAITLSGVISGPGGLTKAGAGNLTLSGSASNTYAGTTTLGGGTGAFLSSFTSFAKTNGAIAVPGNLILDAGASGTATGVGTALNTSRNQFGQQFGPSTVISFANTSAALHGYFSLYGNDQTVAGISESVNAGGIIQNSQTEVFGIDATLTINNSADFSYTGYLRDNSATGTGKLNIVKTGAGTQSLLGAQILYTGSTTINAGTLELNGVTGFNSSNVTFGTGSTGTLQIAGTALTIKNLSTADALANNAFIQNKSGTSLVLTVNQLVDGVFGGVLRDNAGGNTLSLTKIGAGKLTLTNANTYTGNTSVTAGTLSISSNANLGASTSQLSVTGGASLQITGTTMNSFTPGKFNAATFNGTLDIADPANVFTLSEALTGAGSVSKSGAGTLVLSGANTFTGNAVINAGILRLGSSSSFSPLFLTFPDTAPTGTKLQLFGFNSTLGGGANSGLASSSTTAIIENGAATASTLTINSGVSNTFAGLIQDGGAGILNFTKTGAQSFSLTNANTYTGVTTISAGTLAISQIANGGVASGIGASSNSAANLIINGATLRYSGGTASTDRSFNVGTAGATLDASGTGALTFSNTAAFGFNGQTGARTFTLTGTNTASNTYAGKITDNGVGNATSVTKAGSGTWVLTNPTSDYTGSTTISGGGRLVVPNTLGATNVTISGGTLAMGGNGTTTGVIGIAGGTNTVTLAGGAVASASRGTLDLVDGTLDTLTLNSDAATTVLTMGGTAAGNASALNFEIGAGNSSDTLIIALGKLVANLGGVQLNTTALAGAGGGGTYNLITFGSGQATGLANFYIGKTPSSAFSYTLDTSSGTGVKLVASSTFTNSTYTGTGSGNWTDNTKWNGGVPTGTGATVAFGNSITAASTITLTGYSTAGTLTIDGANAYTIAGTSGALVFNNNGAAATLTVPTGAHTISAPVILVDDTTTAVNGTSTLTVSGIVSGDGALKKTGTGGLVLTGNNTYSGGFSITGGSVTISNDLNLGAAPAAINPTAFFIDGATLRSTTTIAWSGNRGITLGSSGATFFSATGNLTIGAPIVDANSTPGVLTITGASTTALWVPGGANTYAGGTILLSGVTVPQSNSTGPAGSPTSGPFGTGLLTLAGGQMRASTGATAGATIGNAVAITADTTFIAGTVANTDRDLFFTGPATLIGGTRTLTVSTAVASGFVGIQFLGAIGDGGNGYGLIKAGTGTGALVLGGNNTFTGGLSIRAGSVIAQTNANALGGSGTGLVTLGNTTGTDATSLIGAGALTFANPIVVAAGSSGVSTLGSQGASATVFSGPITLNKALTLSTAGTATLTLSGAITGSSALTIAGGTGFVQLSGSNAAFTGPVTINSGILQIGVAGALSANNAVTMTAGTLELNGLSLSLKSLAGAGAVNNKGVAATLTVGDSTNTTYSGNLTATTAANLALTKVGSGTLTLSGLNTYTGATAINGGTLLLDMSTNNTGVLKASALTLSNGTLSLKGRTGAFTSTQTLGTLTLAAGTSNSIVIDANAGTSTGLTLGAWTRGAGSTLFVDISSTGSSLTASPTLTNGILSYAAVKDSTGTGFATVTGGKVVRAADNALAAASNDSTGNFTTKVTDPAYSGGVLTMAASAHASNSLSINSDPGAGTIDLAAQTLSVTSGSVLMSGANNYTIQNGTVGASGSNLLFMTYGAGTLVLNTAVSGGAGTVTKSGSGTLQLSGTNTYTGTTTINDGKLIVSGGNAISNAGVVSIANKAGAIFQVNASETIGSFIGGGASGGEIVLGSGFTLSTLDATNPTYDGLISGAGNLAIGGSNTTTLTGSNTYAGTTTISTGILRISNGSALGNTGTATSTTVSNGARLELFGGITVNNETATINGNGGANSSGAIQAVGPATSTWTGNIILGSAAARLGASGGGTLIVSGVVSGAFALGIRTVDLTNVVVMSGVSTYTGATNIVVGTLQLAGGDNRLPIGTLLQMNNAVNSGSSKFDLNGFNQQISGITSLDNATSVQEITSATTATLTVNGTVTPTLPYTGIITGALGLTKAGTNAQTLSGANTYTGPTTISGGSLIVSGSLSASGTVSIGDNAVLAGTGTVGNVTVTAATPGTTRGGVVDPGNGAATVAANGLVTGNNVAGILTTGTFSLNSGAHLSLQLGGATAGTYDQVSATTLTLAGDLQGSLLTGYTATVGQMYFILVQSGSALAGSFGTFSNLAEGGLITLGSQLFQITYAANWTGSDATSSFTGGNDVALMAVVPEPNTLITLLGSLATVLGLRRFRRKGALATA